MFLFTVEERYMITGRGLILTPGMGEKKASVGDRIKIIRPDQTIIYTKITGISFNDSLDILIGNGLTKEDVPIGSEVWLDKE